MTWINRAASKFALKLVNSSPLRISRNGLEVEFQSLDSAYTPSSRSRIGAHLLGARIGMDTRCTTYDFIDERPSVDISKRLSEAPSAYGRRFPRLIHVTALHVAESIAQCSLFHTPAPEPNYVTIYVREVGKGLHALNQTEHANHYKDGELESLSRSALFHEPGAYKPQTRHIRTQHGRIRVYQNTDSVMATRSLLLPDFDLDASREGGFATIPDIDILLVAEPSDEDRDALKWELMATSSRLWRDAVIPFSSAVFELNMKGMEVLTDSWSPREIVHQSPLSVTSSSLESS